MCIVMYSYGKPISSPYSKLVIWRSLPMLQVTWGGGGGAERLGRERGM